MPNVVQKDFADSPNWGLSADVCLSIAEEAAAGGARTVVLLIPAVEQVDRERFEASARAFRVDTAGIDVDQPSRILRREMKARGLEVIDLLPVLREAQDTGGDLYGRIDWHLTPRGNEVVASYLLPIVAEGLTAATDTTADAPAPAVD